MGEGKRDDLNQTGMDGPVPGSMGGHAMTPISDERSSRMWWLPLGVYVPGGLGGLGKPAWWHGTLAASEPG